MFTFLSIYINDYEKKIDQFLSSINENSSREDTFIDLRYFLKVDLAGFFLWIERKYFGYKYLTKNKRKQLLQKANLCVDEFLEFEKNSNLNEEKVQGEIMKIGLTENTYKQFKIDYLLLAKINEFIHRKMDYCYQEAMSFGMLFDKISENKIIGDCNQIVSLYIYLFSKRSNIEKLKLSIYPNHVCLNLQDIDIESTRGIFLKPFASRIRTVRVEEIVSINILDISESQRPSYSITEKNILESSRLAFLVSSEQQIVKENIIIANKRFSLGQLEQGSYESAIRFARRTNDGKFIKSVIFSIVNKLCQQSSFDRAKKIASNYKDIRRQIIYNWGLALYKKRAYSEARTKFKEISDSKLVKACYESEYLDLQQKIATFKTKEDFKKKISIIKKMKSLANSSGNQKMIKQIDTIVRFINRQ